MLSFNLICIFTSMLYFCIFGFFLLVGLSSYFVLFFIIIPSFCLENSFQSCIFSYARHCLPLPLYFALLAW